MGLLDGEVAIITGAGTGIGAATALRFVQEGASVVMVGRRREKLEETARAAGRTDRLAVVPGDVRDQKTVDAAIAAATKLGGLHVVVNNAAVAYPADLPSRPDGRLL